MKSAMVFIVSLIVFSGIAVAAYFALDYYLEWTPRETPLQAEVFLPMPEPEYLAYTNTDDELNQEDMQAYDYNDYEEYYQQYNPEAYAYEPVCNLVTITLSVAGDTTLGGDRRWAGYHAFMREFENSGQDHSFFFRNIAHIFYDSDLSIVNLEGTLTYATYHMDKPFVFRGPPHFARILSLGNVDAVTISNNHTIDFGQRGYEDTIEALRAEDIVYFGNEFKTIMEVNGIYVGLFGYRIWNDSAENRNRIRAAIYNLQNRGAQLIIAYYHWGTEHVNRPEQYQINIGRYSIRNGADLVLGAHPHVIQGIEEYMGRFIVYSLANFSFGGNANPRDQDSFIFQQTFSFYNGVLLPDIYKNIIPVFVSSVRNRNNFQPTVAEGADAERIMARIERYSEWLR